MATPLRPLVRTARPEQILQENFHRRPLRCDCGRCRKNLAESQARQALLCTMIGYMLPLGCYK